MTTFDAPPKASTNCRHYAYAIGDGPSCARGVDVKGRRDTRPCLPPAKAHGLFQGHPGPLGLCPQRADYTEAERKAWNAYVEARAMRLLVAINSLPPMDDDTEADAGTQPCPNCRDGTLSWDRRPQRHSLACTTPNCTGPATYRTGTP